MLSQIHIIGGRTRERFVLHEACPALWQYRISMCGLTDARPPYRMERPRLAFSEMVIGLNGTGRVWLEGNWRDLGPGEAYISAAGQDQRFYADKRWAFVWVHFNETDALTYIAAHTPRIVKATGVSLASVVDTLYKEMQGPGDPGVTSHLAALVALYARRITGGVTGDERLWRLWRIVDSEPDRKWSLDLLAKLACMSPEHLRRQCHRELGKSPLAHVTNLRMQRAAVLLKLGTVKIEILASKVGYGSPYAFSSAFKRWAGMPPSAYRAQSRLVKTPA